MKTNHVLFFIILYAVYRYFASKATTPATGAGTPAATPNNQTLLRDMNDLYGVIDDKVDSLSNKTLPIYVNTLADLKFPINRKAIIYASQDTYFTDEPTMHVYFSDGVAASIGDLYSSPLQRLSTLVDLP